MVNIMVVFILLYSVTVGPKITFLLTVKCLFLENYNKTLFTQILDFY